MYRFQTNPYLLLEWNEIKYLFYWAESNRFTLRRKLMLSSISMETELAEASCMQCLGLSRAEFGSHIPRNLNWLHAANMQCQSPRYFSHFPLGTGYPPWEALPPTDASALSTGSAAPVLAAAPASACLFINGFIFSGFEIERCWATFCPFCSASALAGRTGRGRTQRRGTVAAFFSCNSALRAGSHSSAQLSSAVPVAFQHNGFCEQRMCILCFWCSLYFAGFFRCRALNKWNHPVGSCLEISCYFKRREKYLNSGILMCLS